MQFLCLRRSAFAGGSDDVARAQRTISAGIGCRESVQSENNGYVFRSGSARRTYQTVAGTINAARPTLLMGERLTEQLHSTSGPQARLLAHNERILLLQEAIRVRRLELRTRLVFGVAAIASALIIFVVTTLTWGKLDLGQINRVAIPITLLVILAFVALLIVEYDRPKDKRTSVRRLQLDLELAEESRRINAAQLGLPVYQRQYAYKDVIPRELRQLRAEAKRYGRIHNAFQSIIIIGSLGTTTAASLAATPSSLKWVTVGLSFLVGVSAGFTGYFKYRERSFYLQQTADSIEQNLSAFDLGIHPYDATDESLNLHKLATDIEIIKAEQRKRQQQLDQPHEAKSDT
ncbi:hypothetical protein BN979_04838 [Mycolicibacterium vulneris]|nr:hypothetical protein BN979_04838 [Mycolicibacterium vulneris]